MQLEMEQTRNQTLKAANNRLIADYSQLVAANQNLQRQLATKTQSNSDIQSKYKALKQEFNECKQNYQRELERCITEISQLREVVDHVITETHKEPAKAKKH